MSRYTAVHVKQDGKWLMADVRDTRTNCRRMQGSWRTWSGWLVPGDRAANAHIAIQCRWIENQHFLARTNQVKEGEKVISTGLEIIGLDPSTGRITSWHFTSDGGHAIGLWTPYENGWIVESAGVMKDGTPTSATNITLSVRTKTPCFGNLVTGCWATNCCQIPKK